MSTPCVVAIKCQAKEGMGQTALEAFKQLIATVKQLESDCLNITLHSNDDDPDQLMLYEIWSSREAYQGPHMQTPHLQAFIADSMAFLTGPPDISYWKQIDT